MNASKNGSEKKITPRALVRKQVENEDFHVSEEDMANLDTSIESIDGESNDFAKPMSNDELYNQSR